MEVEHGTAVVPLQVPILTNLAAQEAPAAQFGGSSRGPLHRITHLR
jgi:hypothetical protein